MESKQNQDIPITNKNIKNAIGLLSNSLKPATQAAPSAATRPKASEAGVKRQMVDVNNNDNRRPRVNNNNNDDNSTSRVLQP